MLLKGLMSRPLEHVYIGLSEVSSMGSSDKISSSSSTVSTEVGEKNNALNLKETELRLGLPGSESPERKVGGGVSVLGKGVEDKSGYSVSGLKNFVSGAKRGFSDALDGSGNWVLSGNGGSEVDLGKGAVLFSPRGGNGGKSLGGLENSTQQLGSAAPALKDVVPPSPKPVQEKKPQMCAANDHGIAPAAK